MSLLSTSLFHSGHQSHLNYFLGLFGLPIIQGWLWWTLGWNPSWISALPCLIERECEGLLTACQASNPAGQCRCQQVRGFQREEEENHQQWSWKMVLLGRIHTSQIRIGGKKGKLCILTEDCENDTSWKPHGAATRESWQFLMMQSACSHWFVPHKSTSGAPWPLQPLKNPSNVTPASVEVFFTVIFPSNAIDVSSSKELSLTNSLRKCEGSTISSCLLWVMAVLPRQPPCWNVSAPFWKPLCDHGSTQWHLNPIRKPGTWWAHYVNYRISWVGRDS